jgi:hypothetical protein
VTATTDATSYKAERQRIIIDAGRAEAARQLAAANPQVTALSRVPSTPGTYMDLRKRSDLGKWAGRTAHIRDRDILTDPDKRLKKLCVETGWDTARNRPLRSPLEPWTCPVSMSRIMYADIMRDPDGAHHIGEYSGNGLTAIEWMREEELIAIGASGEIRALGDMTRDAGRAYPGAPVPDSQAKIGRQLRHRAVGKVLAALFNISRGGAVRWSRRRSQKAIAAPGGLRLSAAQVCAAANQLIAADPALEDYRYLSVSTCREIIKALIETGHVTEAVAAKAIRRMRSWFTLPRVIGRLDEDLSQRADVTADVTEWRRQA